MALDQTHDQQKADYRLAQQRARDLAGVVNRVLDRAVVEVGASPTVWQTEDGAFVEAVIWVPRAPEGG